MTPLPGSILALRGEEMKTVFVPGSILLLPSCVYQRPDIFMYSMTMFPRDLQVGQAQAKLNTVSFCGHFPAPTGHRPLSTFPDINACVQSHTPEPTPLSPRVSPKGRRISD